MAGEGPLKRRRIHLVLRLSVAVGLLAFLLHQIGLAEIARQIGSLDFFYIPMVLAALALSHLANGITLKLSSRRLPIGLGTSLFLSLKAWSWGQYTPARIGEVSLVYYLHGLGLTWGASAAIAFVNRAVVLFYLGVLAGVGMLAYGLKGVEVQWPLVLSGFAILSGGLVLGIVLLRRSRSSLVERFGKQAVEFKEALSDLAHHPVIASGILVTQLARVLFLFGVTKLLFSGMGADVKYAQICIVNAFARMAALLPVSVNGLGIREGVQVWLYGDVSGVEAPVVLGMAIVANVILYGSAACAILFLPNRHAPKEVRHGLS
jgi:hypothetical protein